MTLAKVTVKAPGSMMIMGEHAVLHNQPAMVAAINRWITLTLEVRNDEQLNIESIYGSYLQPIKQAPTEPWVEWIYFIIESFFEDLPEIKNGLTIKIESTFEGAVGLSSSTALTVALLYALAQWVATDSSDKDKKQWVFAEAMDLLEQKNKVASGAALQAVIHGGLRLFDSKKKQSQRIDQSLPCYLVYCGYKTPTEQVVRHISEKFKGNKAALDSLYNQMGAYVLSGLQALEDNKVELFYKAIGDYYLLQKKIGVADDQLDQMIELSRQSQLTHAAKISGAGLGDCILVIGEIDRHLWRSMQDVQMIEIDIVEKGVQVC